MTAFFLYLAIRDNVYYVNYNWHRALLLIAYLTGIAYEPYRLFSAAKPHPVFDP